MSLLERQLRAAQAAQEAEAAAATAAAQSSVAPAADATAQPSANGSTAVADGPPGSNLPAVIPVQEKGRAPATGRNAAREEMIHDLRLRMQGEVINAFDSLLDATPAETRTRIEGIVDRVIETHNFAVTRDERQRLVQEMINEITGFGPLEPLLSDPTITEVMVNGPDHIYIERKGKILKVDSFFLNNEHVLRIIDRIIRPLGRRIDETSPRVDARLPDGSRVNAIIAPLSLIGPVITVRKFSKTPYTVNDLISFGTATPEMFEFLRACVEARLNIFVSGG
ncbi:MAG TPA: ATPase, T2SS/T4P/T4SS family, partial [Candidatus Limnocylindrales bacterium]|nr:ATPase, T2SS/T4P/T4SS family [Candidatus Limnocylindrales bacterium]